MPRPLSSPEAPHSTLEAKISGVCGRSQLQEHQLRQRGAPVVVHEDMFGGQGNVGDL